MALKNIPDLIIGKENTFIQLGDIQRHAPAFQKIIDSLGKEIRRNWIQQYACLVREWNTEYPKKKLPTRTRGSYSVFAYFNIIDQTAENLEQLLGIRFCTHDLVLTDTLELSDPIDVIDDVSERIAGIYGEDEPLVGSMEELASHAEFMDFWQENTLPQTSAYKPSSGDIYMQGNMMQMTRAYSIRLSRIPENTRDIILNLFLEFNQR